MDRLQIKYPIYIVSKGRPDTCLTANFLKKENIDFTIAVEPQEYEAYCKSIGQKHIAKLPFSNLGVGSYPARNWCWEHSAKNGFDFHFIFDDNIRCFYRLSAGVRKQTNAKLALLTLQSFIERYENLSIAGYNYSGFVTKRDKFPVVINAHVYSGMIIKNCIPQRWRLKYNEDVDLCLQILNDKQCTALLNAFLIAKTSTTAKMPGGNQTELYKNNAFEKKVLKARSLEQIWPQYAKTTFKFGRPHHHVSWRKHFKHKLIRKENFDQIVENQIVKGTL